jgi:hypothetical protein
MAETEQRFVMDTSFSRLTGKRTGSPVVLKGTPMKEPGLDNRHRDKNPPKSGEIQQKRGDTLNKNLPKPIPQFSGNARLDTMRRETGKVSEEAVRRAAKRIRP